ncbi:C-type lectin domain family 4 member M, partial [Biomphalaria pfeifferi]
MCYLNGLYVLRYFRITDERGYVFYHKVEQNSVTQYDTVILQAKSRIDCARECQLKKCGCFSYSNQACSI